MKNKSTNLQSQIGSTILAPPSLAVSRYCFHFTALDPVSLPAYQGSTWRGIFGHQLKRTVCVARHTHCESCELYHRCAHASIFETPVGTSANKMRRYPHAPHPYIFSLPWRGKHALEAGDNITAGFNLVGNANDKLPYIIAAMQNIKHKPIGKGNGHLQLIGVEQETETGHRQWQSILDGEGALQARETKTHIPPAPGAALRITLKTPLRLAENNRPLSAEKFQPHHLLRNLIRRVSLLSTFHTDTPLETDFRALNQMARELPLQQADLHWNDWQRYSNRKQRPIKMGGLRGQFVIEQLPDALWPYLWLGQWIHAGKGTVMGLGHYRLEPASLPAE